MIELTVYKKYNLCWKCLCLIVIKKLSENEFNDKDEVFDELVPGVVCTRGANRSRGAGGNLANRNLLSVDAVNNIRGNSSNPCSSVPDSASAHYSNTSNVCGVCKSPV